MTRAAFFDKVHPIVSQRDDTSILFVRLTEKNSNSGIKNKKKKVLVRVSQVRGHLVAHATQTRTSARDPVLSARERLPKGGAHNGHAENAVQR